MDNQLPPHELPDDPVMARVLDIGHLLENRTDAPWTIERTVASDVDPWASVARSIAAIVGSPAALDELDDQPLADEPFDWTGISADDRPLVQTLLDLTERLTPAGAGRGDTLWEVLGLADAGMPWVDDEYRTIIRQVLYRLAVHPDHPLNRRSNSERLAAAIVWVALDASGGLPIRGRRWKRRDLWNWFGVNSCVKLGRALGQAIAQHFDADQSWRAFHDNRVVLGDPQLLHSRYRSQLIAERDQLVQQTRKHHNRVRDNHPIQCHDGENVQIRSRPVTVRWASRGTTDVGRASIIVALGEDSADLEVIALSVTDARRLISVVEHALAEPLAS